jgi:3-dehydroquinate synthase
MTTPDAPKGGRAAPPEPPDAPPGARLTYPIAIENGLIDRVGETLRRAMPAHSYAVVTDENVAAIYGGRVLQSIGSQLAHLFTMSPGESHKNVDSWSGLTEQLLRAGMRRDSAIVALGGGIVGDVAGFVAATFMRGVPYVQVPTTVVAMVDSSIGGKTGVNTPSGKNLIGSFHPPAAVLIDPQVLATLPARELRAGMAEIIKHGAVADAAYFEHVTAALDDIIATGGSTAAMLPVIRRSIGIKSTVVAADERERGLRKVLNFGHTIGHAVEALSGFTMLHGEAISVGMVLESRLGERAGITMPGSADRLRAVLLRAGLPVERPEHMSAAAIFEAALTDKKVRKGELELALVKEIGTMAGAETGWTVRVSRDLFLESIE